MIQALLALSLFGCPASQEPESEPEVTCKLTLESSDDQAAIQTALIEAKPNEMICFGEHTWMFDSELSLSVDDVILRGAGADKTIFDFSGQQTGANGLAITGNGVVLENFRVQHTPGDGVRATDVDGITFRELTVHWDPPTEENTNGAYGLYPVGSENVLITGCTVTGARDAGIYVGQSKNVRVEDSVAYGNVAGIEIENTTDAEVTRCETYENTAGILVFNLPGLPVQDGRRTKVHDNEIRGNNLENFAEPGTVVADVPSGVGIMILAADETEVHDNDITENRTSGVLLISYSEPIFGPVNDPGFDIYAEKTYLHDNLFSSNGTDPQGQLAGFIADRPAPDIAADGCEASPGGMALCVENNGDATYIDVDVCGLFQNQSTDIEAVTCAHDPLPPISL